VAKLRHLAIATSDPERTAQFFVDAFEFKLVRTAEGIWGDGLILSDGTMNLAILRFSTDEAAGVERGRHFEGLHHIGFEVEDVDEVADRVSALGARRRGDIDAALGLTHDGPVKGEFKFEGPNGVVFDLSEAGVWQLA
jgi:catechol 2,3-dioxygenase-like lactoylglutathione lyase family enzyme